MSADLFLQYLTQALFVGVAIVVTAAAVRRPNRIMIDRVLLFVALGISISVGWITSLLNIQPSPVQMAITSSLIMLFPYMLLRLVDNFAGVPGIVLRLAEVGTITAVISLFLTSATDRSSAVTLFLIGHFAVFSLYAAGVIVRATGRTSGVTRRRMQAAALGIYLLGFVVAIAGVRLFVPEPDELWTILSRLGAIASAVAFVIGFATPTFLRRAWQDHELREFLAMTAPLTRVSRTEDVVREIENTTGAATGMTATILLWDEDYQILRQASSGDATPLVVDRDERLSRQVFDQQHPRVSLNPRRDFSDDAALFEQAGIVAIMAAPITAGEKRIGVLRAHSTRPLLFADDDLALLQVLARQAAVILETRLLLVRAEAARAKLAEQAEDLHRSNEELQQFAYVASHDLQEPLRMVASYVQLLARRYQGKLDQDADEFIGFAVEGARRMQTLINDLLSYSRVGTRGRALEPIEVDSILDAVLSDLRLAIADADATVTRDPLPSIVADPTQLHQLLQNLIGNALRFRRDEPPRIHVGARREDDVWVFSVCDNGIGIEPQYFDRIFVIFQRLHGRADYPGTGIGLAIAKKIVERHGGRIWVESKPGQGTTFFFTMPATDTTASEGVAPSGQSTSV